jgi:phage head maturation protease
MQEDLLAAQFESPTNSPSWVSAHDVAMLHADDDTVEPVPYFRELRLPVKPRGIRI